MADSNLSLAAKNNRKKFLPILLVSTIPIIGITYGILKNPIKEISEFSKNPVLFSFFFLIFLFFFGFFFYKYFFDKKIKLLINQEGIWTLKYGQVAWPSVWYIYQEEIRGKIREQKLIIKLHEDYVEIKLDTTYFDKTEDEIMTALKENSSQFNILFLDKEVRKMY